MEINDYANSSYIGDPKYKKSTTRYYFFLGKKIVI